MSGLLIQCFNLDTTDPERDRLLLAGGAGLAPDL